MRRMPPCVPRSGSSRTGNSTILRPPATTTPLFGLWRDLGNPFRLLSVDESDARTKADGNWVLTLRSRVQTVGPTGPSITPCAPLIARVSFGVGGITQQVEVDAFNSVLSVPSETVFVDMLYTQIAPAAGAPGTPNTLFSEIEVFGTLNKGIESGEGTPLRSYFINASAGVGIPVDVPIPPFATAWCYIPVTEVLAASLPLAGAYVMAGPIGSGYSRVLESVIPEVTASMARMHCFRDLPSEAGRLSLLLTNSSWYGSLIFQIGL